MAGLLQIWKMMQISKQVAAIPTANWRVALCDDLDHPDFLRLSARMTDGKEITIMRRSARRMLDNILVDESDVYNLIIGSTMFDDDAMTQHSVQQMYRDLVKRLKDIIDPYISEKKRERREQGTPTESA